MLKPVLYINIDNDWKIVHEIDPSCGVTKIAYRNQNEQYNGQALYTYSQNTPQFYFRYIRSNLDFKKYWKFEEISTKRGWGNCVFSTEPNPDGNDNAWFLMCDVETVECEDE